MDIVNAPLNELPWFLAYMGMALCLTMFYIITYIWITPHPEIKLIRDNNLAAALSFGGSLIGFCLPLASAIAHSTSLLECAIWGLIAVLVQVLMFYLVCLPIPKISEKIEKGEIASGLWLGVISLAGGLLNAASMTN